MEKNSSIHYATFSNTLPSQASLYDDYEHLYVTEMAIWHSATMWEMNEVLEMRYLCIKGRVQHTVQATDSISGGVVYLTKTNKKGQYDAMATPNRKWDNWTFKKCTYNGMWCTCPTPYIRCASYWLYMSSRHWWWSVALGFLISCKITKLWLYEFRYHIKK